MKNLFKTKKSTFISYSVICLILIAISLLFLLINCYEVTMILSVTSFVNLFYLLLILYFGADPKTKILAKGKNVAIFTVLRTLIAILSLTFATLCLLFTKNAMFDSKYRMLFILISLVPYFLAIGSFNFYSKLGE